MTDRPAFERERERARLREEIRAHLQRGDTPAALEKVRQLDRLESKNRARR